MERRSSNDIRYLLLTFGAVGSDRVDGGIVGSTGSSGGISGRSGGMSGGSCGMGGGSEGMSGGGSKGNIDDCFGGGMGRFIGGNIGEIGGGIGVTIGGGAGYARGKGGFMQFNRIVTSQPLLNRGSAGVDASGSAGVDALVCYVLGSPFDSRHNQ
ncbi:hypothetical protein DY251_03945 [Mesorhizobium denitrificans]|uniref:Uncharacterized protein n=1 Tax=Mesorhizobium denitrificans TaxID=2294114 RepID=A0A371XHU3_9HYPH|nr:hypothetical protein DY251_03945 [Mesorhizobium denitrificans]